MHFSAMQQDPHAPLLLIGFQRGAGRALERLRRPAFVLVPRGQARAAIDGIADRREVDLHGDLASIEATAREMLGAHRPAAVVALAERTVVVAAHLRESLGLGGNSASTALVCADKVEMKRAMDAAGVPVAAWRAIDASTSSAELIEALGLPLVVKPRRDSGGRGQQRLDDQKDVEAALSKLRGAAAGGEGFGWLAEAWIEGVEMSVETFVHEGLPVFVNPTEYLVPRHANIVPAELSPAMQEEIRGFNARALEAAGVERGLTHLELFRTARGLVFGELASRPPGGRLMPLLRRAWAFDPWEAMLRLECGETFEFPTAPRRSAGVWVLHPGVGRVVSIRGLAEARALPDVRRVTLKVETGSTIGPRYGSGQDVGAIYAEGADRTCVAAALTAAHDRIEFDLAMVTENH